MDDYLQHKPGHLKLANTKNKYGVGWKTGATLRKNCYTERQGSAHRNNSLILKHVAVTEKWSPAQVENDVAFDDGDLQRHKYHKQNGKRGKAAKSSVAKQLAKETGVRGPKSSSVTYSMNKKNRWLLPAAIKEEIDQQKATVTNVDLTLVERELSQHRRRIRRPDTIAVASTSIPEKENFPKPKHRKSKRKTYSYSTDLLGLSQKVERDEEQSNDELDTIKPEVTYEVCQPRMRGPYSIHPMKENSSVKKEKERRSSRGKKNHYHEEDALQYYRARKSHDAATNDLI